MSEQYPGGFISKSPPTPTGPFETDLAYGMWTLSQAAAYIKQGLWPTAGNPNTGQQAYTTAGTYSWVAPIGVTSVSVVAVGGGGSGGSNQYGGGGGGLGYKNNYAVTAGNSYTVVVGVAGFVASGASTGVNGGDSYFVSTGTVKGGGGGGSGAAGTYTGDGGGNGGTGGGTGSGYPNWGGGGGAGGYAGNGGAGAVNATSS